MVSFHSRDPHTSFSVGESHWPFLIRDLEPTMEIGCRIAPIQRRTDSPTYSIQNIWDIWKATDGVEEMIFYRGTHREPSWRLRMDADFRLGELDQAPTAYARTIRADDSPMLQYLVVRALGRAGSLVVHASTAIVDGEALVFVGHSRAGKSTIARIAEEAGARIPTDDRTILTCENGIVMAWGSPWYGSLVRKTPEGAPVRAIFLLQQANENRVERIEPARSLKELFVRLVQPRLDPRELDRSLTRLEDIVRTVKVSVLHFRPSAEAFDLARQASTASS
ncbi:MAG: hypothetical protein ACJ796_23185 [Gemmatimonadaceae bacterium]